MLRPRLLNQRLKNLSAGIVPSAFAKGAVDIVFLLLKLQLVSQKLNHFLLLLVLFLELDQQLLSVARSRYGVVLNVFLKLFKLCLIDSKVRVLLLECLVLTLQESVIHEKHIDGLYMTLGQGGSLLAFLGLGQELLDNSKVLGAIKMFLFLFLFRTQNIFVCGQGSIATFFKSQSVLCQGSVSRQIRVIWQSKLQESLF